MPYKDPEKRREAQRKAAKRYAERHREKVNAYAREYRKRDGAWFARNRDKVRKQQREWERVNRVRNPEKHRAKNNTPSARLCRKRWYEENRERLNRERRKQREAPEAKAQRSQYARLDKLRNPDTYRDRSYRQKYGITLEDYNRMFAEQGGACAICREPCRGSREQPYLRLHVDHNHETKKVRGLLCRRCNVSVGYLEHLDRAIREPAEAYLVRHRE